MLLEVRLSPQLNIWIYGFFQHNFDQMMRYGGFRPIVFLPHGALGRLLRDDDGGRVRRPLARWLRERSADFLHAAPGTSACARPLQDARGTRSTPSSSCRWWRCFGVEPQIRIAAGLAMIAVLFPLLRGADLVPVDAMLAQAERVDPERARSLAFRFDNEAQLLAHANERPLFGWGGWGRNRLYDP